MSLVRVAGFFLLFTSGLLSSTLQAQPQMEVIWTNFLGDYDNLSPGPERAFIYTLRNTSPDVATNEMFAIQIPVGLNAGLFYAEHDRPNWETWYGGETTYLSTTNNPIRPGEQITVEIRAASLLTRPAYITARGASDYSAFPPVLVEAAAPPYPPTLTGITSTNNTATISAERLLPQYTYTLEQSSSHTAWTPVLTFVATNVAETLTPPPATNATMFYRLRSP